VGFDIHHSSSKKRLNKTHETYSILLESLMFSAGIILALFHSFIIEELLSIPEELRNYNLILKINKITDLTTDSIYKSVINIIFHL